MAVQINHISPQYFRKGEICVSILEIKSPVHFIVKECPDINTSSDAKEFVEAEELMQAYFHSKEAEFFQLPLKDSIVVVQHKNKYYRAQVRSILNAVEGHRIKVYLLDYGQECTIPRQCLYEIPQDFLLYPFQAVDFKIIDIEPISLVVSSMDLSFEHGKNPEPAFNSVPKSPRQQKPWWNADCAASYKEGQKAWQSFRRHPTSENRIKYKIAKAFARSVRRYCKKEWEENPVSTWDVSAMDFIEEKQKVMNSAHIKVQGVGENYLFGTLYLTFNNQEVICINEELILRKFAQQKKDLNGEMELSPDTQQPSVAIEEADCNSARPQEGPSTPTSSETPKFLTVVHPSPAPLSPTSQNKPNESMSKLQKLKMLKKKSPGGSASNSPLVLSPVAAIDTSKTPTLDVFLDTTVNENKLNTPENKISNATPSRTELSGKSQLHKLMKCRNTKKSSLSPQVAPDSSTPLSNQACNEVSCDGSLTPMVQTSVGRFPGSVIDGISPISGNKLNALSSESSSLSLKEDTNSLNVAFMNSAQAKDVQKSSELSTSVLLDPNSNKENSTKTSPKPTSTKVRNLKDLYKKRNSLPSKSESKPDEKVLTNLNTIEPDLKPEACIKDVKLCESDSEKPLPVFEDGLNEGFSDVEDMGDLLQCVLKPKGMPAIDSSPDSRYVKK